MKIFYTFTFLFLLAITSKSQTWAPDGAKWHYTLNWLSATDYAFNSYTVQGDTMINGITCSKLNRHTYSCNFRPYTEYMYRDSNKVYYWNAGDNSFSLLYDFGVQPGNSYKIPVVEGNTATAPYDTFTVTIDSIYTLNINGQNKQVQVVHQTSMLYPNWTIHHSIIEGIGSDQQMFVWDGAACDAQWDRGLRCYEDSILGLYETGIVDSCEEVFTLTSLDIQLTDDEFMVYPVPASDFIHWTGTEAGFQKVRLIDINGRVIREAETYDRKMDLRGIENGIYIIEVRALSGGIMHGKIRCQ